MDTAGELASLPKVTYNAVADTTGKNPKNEGWYEVIADYTYVLTEDTTPDEEKTYYTLGDDGIIVKGSMAYVKSEDKTYVYNGASWDEFESGGLSPDDRDLLANANSRIVNMESFVKNNFELERRILELEKFGIDHTFTNVCTDTNFVDTTFKKDFLPVHETYQFCREFKFRYSADFAGTENPETIKINNKEVEFVENIGTNEGSADVHNIDIVASVNNSSKAIELSIYKDDILVETQEIGDSFILTFELTTSGATPVFGTLTATYMKMKYPDVALDYEYPVFELRDGSVLYMSTTPTMKMGKTYDLLACYNLGSKTTTLPTGLLAVCDGYDSASHGMTGDSGHKGCEYIYMANWLWMENIASAGLWWYHLNANSDTAIFQDFRSIVKELDYSKIKLSKIKNYPFANIFYGYWGEYIADDITNVINCNIADPATDSLIFSMAGCKYLGMNLYKIPVENYKTVQFKNSRSLKTIGDVSGWNVTHFTTFGTMFSNCFSLEFIGDVGKWGEQGAFENVGKNGNGGVMGNIFKACVKLQGITDKIRTWRFPNTTSIAWMFENVMYIGDETLHGLGEWEVGSVNNFRGTFCYWVEDTVTESLRRHFVVERHEPMPTIVNKRTDLSFVDQWDMHNADRLQGFFANNPYLVNVGQLSNWTLTNPNLLTQNEASGYGMFDFLKNCSALENLNMPSIPRGVDVNGFVDGCTSLANITLDELNVDAISFGDCPLTKQSVLNLINAATADVDITLKSDVYAEMVEDADVQSAISAKLGSSITVNLGTI